MFGWHFSDSNVSQIENASPALNSPGHHSSFDYIVGEIIYCGNQMLNGQFSIDNASDVDNNDWSLVFVAFVGINYATV